MGADDVAPFLLLSRLHKHFGGLAAIRDVDLAVRRGDIHAIIGPNGAGKTTVFNCISAFVQPSSGQIWFDGARIDGVPPHRVAARGIGRTYQNVRLFREMSALDNVLVGEHRRLVAPVWEAVLRTKRFRHEEADARARAGDLLGFVGVVAPAHTLARNLSYGDQRRLEIARVLAARPSLLLLDEPAAGMNPTETGALVGLIERIRTELATTVLLIEHHMRVVMTVSDVVTVLDQGRVLAEGAPREVQADPRVVAAYLGTQAGDDSPEADAE